MKEELLKKLHDAVFNYNAAQEQEAEKIDAQNMLTEISSLDNDQIEKAIEEMNKQTKQ